MPTTYAIADLHGRYDLLLKAYELIADHAKDMIGPVKIVHLGDYVDRGPQSREIIEHLMDDATIPDGFSRVVLKGNHEDIMQQGCRHGEQRWWIGNGVGATLISYGHARTGNVDVSIVPASHLEWIDSLPLTHVDTHRIYVHAGVEPNTPLEDQNEEKLIWRLYPTDDERGHGNRHVVHGHHQFEDGPKLYKGRTDLDTFAWYTGRLVVGVFDDDRAGGPVELIEVIGKPDERALAA